VHLSARLSIVETALEEIMTRLEDVRPTEAAQALAARAERLDRALDAWLLEPPTEQRRSEIVKEVLDLAVEVTRLHHAEATEAPRVAASEPAAPLESLWRQAAAPAQAVDPPARAVGSATSRRRRG
jgi:hypothetical protein